MRIYFHYMLRMGEIRRRVGVEVRLRVLCHIHVHVGCVLVIVAVSKSCRKSACYGDERQQPERKPGSRLHVASWLFRIYADPKDGACLTGREIVTCPTPGSLSAGGLVRG